MLGGEAQIERLDGSVTAGANGEVRTKCACVPGVSVAEKVGRKIDLRTNDSSWISTLRGFLPIELASLKEPDRVSMEDDRCLGGISRASQMYVEYRTNGIFEFI